MKAGRIAITYTMLEHLLQWPEGVRITRTYEDTDRWRNNQLWLVVQGDELPYTVREGDILPILTPTCTKNDDGQLTWNFDDRQQPTGQADPGAQRSGLHSKEPPASIPSPSVAPDGLGVQGGDAEQGLRL